MEADQRLDAHAPDTLEVAGAGNAMHDDAEHQHRDDHIDELNEGVAEGLELNCGIRPQQADNYTRPPFPARPDRTGNERTVAYNSPG